MTDIERQYRARHAAFLQPVAASLEAHVRLVVSGCQRIDRISTRAKSVDRFVQKAGKEKDGVRKYSDPLNQIQDQIGARIVTFFLSDVQPIADTLTRYFRAIEQRHVVPDSENEFGYEGEHFIFLLPSDVTAGMPAEHSVEFFELQIKTLFQHAWSEAEHDLGYKAPRSLSALQRRKLAFTAAQAWGADQMFDELQRDLSAS